MCVLDTADNLHKGLLKESLGNVNDMIDVLYMSSTPITQVKVTADTSLILLHKAAAKDVLSDDYRHTLKRNVRGTMRDTPA